MCIKMETNTYLRMEKCSTHLPCFMIILNVWSFYHEQWLISRIKRYFSEGLMSWTMYILCINHCWQKGRRKFHIRPCVHRLALTYLWPSVWWYKGYPCHTDTMLSIIDIMIIGTNKHRKNVTVPAKPLLINTTFERSINN